MERWMCQQCLSGKLSGSGGLRAQHTTTMIGTGLETPFAIRDLRFVKQIAAGGRTGQATGCGWQAGG
jgi:hypothetical protein